jgi:hypothetical protein
MVPNPFHTTISFAHADSPKGEAIGSLLDALWSDMARWLKRGLKVGAAVGILIAIFYFVRIGRFPLDSVSSFWALGQVVALVGAAYALAALFLWGFPLGTVLFAMRVWPMAVRPWFIVDGQPSALRVFAWCACTVGAGWLGLFA